MKTRRNAKPSPAEGSPASHASHHADRKLTIGAVVLSTLAALAALAAGVVLVPESVDPQTLSGAARTAVLDERPAAAPPDAVEAAHETAPARTRPSGESISRFIPRGLGRSRTYEEVVFAGYLNPQRIDAAALRDFWIESADRGAPERDLEVLALIEHAPVTAPAVASAARHYRGDLLDLRGESDRSLPPAEAPRFETLADALRYSGDATEVRGAVRAVSLSRDARALAALGDAARFHDVPIRLAVAEGLWRMLADGAGDEATRRRARADLESSAADRDPAIRALAERALADLDAFEERALRADPLEIASGACPVEMMGCAGEENLE